MRKWKVTEMNRLSVAEFKESPKLPLVLVLDNVRSLNNVGSIFRTADAFRLTGLCLCGITASPPHPEIHKTALGAEEAVAWRHFSATGEAIEALKAGGYVICALEQAEGSIPLGDFAAEKGQKYALVVGNEVKGVEQAAVDASDYCLEIPQYGTKHSLNVAVSAGIAIWELFTRLAPD
jgi:tRNA G18 (ribose-2'-O)-methylase SpoU